VVGEGIQKDRQRFDWVVNERQVVSEVVVVSDAPPLVRLVVVGARKSSDEPGRTRRHSDPGDAIYTARDKPGCLHVLPTIRVTPNTIALRRQQSTQGEAHEKSCNPSGHQNGRIWCFRLRSSLHAGDSHLISLDSQLKVSQFGVVGDATGLSQATMSIALVDPRTRKRLFSCNYLGLIWSRGSPHYLPMAMHACQLWRTSAGMYAVWQSTQPARPLRNVFSGTASANHPADPGPELESSL
jgi:hypothetical protein